MPGKPIITLSVHIALTLKTLNWFYVTVMTGWGRKEKVEMPTKQVPSRSLPTSMVRQGYQSQKRGALK